MNTGVFGKPGTGKTEGQIGRIRDDAQKKAIVLIDPQASLCIRLMMYLMHVLGRVIYVRVRDVERTIGFINLKRSNHPNVLVRMQQDQEHRMLIARLFLGRRALDPNTSPLIWEWLSWGLRLVQYSNSPLYWLPYCFQPWRREFRHMTDKCSDTETTDRFAPVLSWSPTKIRQELSPALRVVETVCLDPAFIGACGDFDIEEAFRQKMIIIVEGQGANKETVRTICLFTMLLAFQFSEKEKASVHVIADEVENFDFATPDVLTALNTLRKQDVDITFISQGLGFEEEVRRKLLQAFQRTEWFGCGSEMAAIGAKEVGVPQISRKVVSHTDQKTRQKHAGYAEQDGRLVSQYADEVENVNHFLSFNDQVKEYEQRLMTLPVGSRLVNHYGRCFLENVKLLKEPYPWGLSERRVEQAIQQIQSRPEYQAPTLIGLPEPKKAQGKRRGDRNGTKKQSKGMKRTRAN